uniref:cupin-like domain-containing protein n=1 Tax=Cellvibrio fontiphilus TaxID=1815559 RepID=UPI002B4BCE05|nr:cupin-like domain-containing protein [Cellvibrio fontiphilus]
MTAYKTIGEFHGLEAGRFFAEFACVSQPIVIRGFAQQWPLVAAAKTSPEQFVNYLLRFYQGKKARIFVAPPAANKRFYYNEDMTGVNYLSGEERLDLFLGRLLELMPRAEYPAISLQNSLIEELLPGLVSENASAYFPDVLPRLWIGNEGIVSAHYDGADNIACVVAGRRRFILFPPEQTANLYPGPLNFTPAGAPTSMVDLNSPDFNRYPDFVVALENAYMAELEPGDAIFIPMLWWHHVESLEKVNGLMNYWWNGSSSRDAASPSPIDSLNLALLAMRDLTPEQRKAWRHMFDHYLFKQGTDPATYIPEHQQHLLGKLEPDYVRAVKDYFIEKLKK